MNVIHCNQSCDLNENKHWLYSTVSSTFKYFETNISISSHLINSNTFNNGHFEVCTPWENHLSLGNFLSIRRVTYGNTSLAAVSAPSSSAPTSSRPHSTIRRSSNCMRNLATEAGNKIFKFSHSQTIIHLHEKSSHRSWKQTFQILAFPNNYSSIFIIYLVKD